MRFLGLRFPLPNPDVSLDLDGELPRVEDRRDLGGGERAAIVGGLQELLDLPGPVAGDVAAHPTVVPGGVVERLRLRRLVSGLEEVLPETLPIVRRFDPHFSHNPRGSVSISTERSGLIEGSFIYPDADRVRPPA